MDCAVVTFLTDYGIDAPELARAVEDRGFAGLYVTEHTHIPTSRRSPWPGGDTLPPQYAHTLDPFVALGAMAAVTGRITLGTAVSLVNQHHPITLAKQVATVDRIAGGRVELGVGPGWNVEEMADHGVDPATRTARMLETVDVLRRVWSEDITEFHGRFFDFEPFWCWPKPVRTPPILMGGTGPRVLDRVLSHADGWVPLRVPVDGLAAFGARVAQLQQRAADLGRGHVPVSMFGAAPRADAVESYRAAGVDRLIFALTDRSGPGARDETLAELDALAALVERVR